MELFETSDLQGNLLDHVIVRDLLKGIESDALDLRNSRVERACQAGPGCTAVAGTGYSFISLEDVVISASGDRGVSSGWRAGVSLTRVRIENSAGIGLSLIAGDGGGSGNGIHLAVDGLRIVGGETYPARIHGRYLESFAGTRAAVDSLLGNGSDTLLIAVSYDSVGPITVYRDLPWRLTVPEIYSQINLLKTPRLTLEPGASVSYGDFGFVVLLARQVEALGTTEDPVVFEGGRLWWGAPGGEAETDTIRFSNARIRGTALESSARGAVSGWGDGAVTLDIEGVDATETTIRMGGRSRGILRTSTFDSSYIVIEDSAQAVLDNVELLRAGFHNFRAHGSLFPAPALHVDSGSVVALSTCEIREGWGDGLYIREAAGEGISINNCNLIDNAGFGVNNLSAFTVDATGNWWGDPAGPDGANGDGVSGDVVVEPVRTEPVQR